MQRQLAEGRRFDVILTTYSYFESNGEASKADRAWLLKQATFAPSQTSTADIAIAGAVFVAAFASGIYFAGK